MYESEEGECCGIDILDFKGTLCEKCPNLTTCTMQHTIDIGATMSTPPSTKEEIKNPGQDKGEGL